MPASTALNETKRALVVSAMMRASVVLPVPGGPHRMIDCSRSRSIASRSGLPGREQILLADELVERARPHPLGERRLRAVGDRRVFVGEQGVHEQFRFLDVQISDLSALAARFVDDERGRDRGVQRLDRRLHRDRDALVGGVDERRRQTLALAADEQRRSAP